MAGISCAGTPGRDSVLLFAVDPVVHAIAQVFARLEVRHVLARQRHGVTGFGVAPHAWRTEMQREAAEAADLDAPPGGECAAHALENHLHGQFDVLGRKVALLARDEFDQLRLCHALPSAELSFLTLRTDTGNGARRLRGGRRICQSSLLPPMCSLRRSPRAVVPPGVPAPRPESSIACASSWSSFALTERLRV